jgi:hypothetical protein
MKKEDTIVAKPAAEQAEKPVVLQPLLLDNKISLHHAVCAYNLSAADPVNKISKADRLTTMEKSSYRGSQFTAMGSTFFTNNQTRITESFKDNKPIPTHVLDAAYTAILPNGDACIAIGDGCGGHKEDPQDEAIAYMAHAATKAAVQELAPYSSGSKLNEDIANRRVVERIKALTIQKFETKYNGKFKDRYATEATTLACARTFQHTVTEKLNVIKVVGFSVGDSLLVAWSPSKKEFTTLCASRNKLDWDMREEVAMFPKRFGDKELQPFTAFLELDAVIIGLTDCVKDHIPCDSEIIRTGCKLLHMPSFSPQNTQTLPISIGYVRSKDKLYHVNQAKGFSHVLMSDKKPDGAIEPYTLIMQREGDKLIAYWAEHKKIMSKAIEGKEVLDIMKRLPQIGEKSNNRDLIKSIILKYGCATKEECLELYLTKENLEKFDSVVNIKALAENSHKSLTDDELAQLPAITRHTPGMYRVTALDKAYMTDLLSKVPADANASDYGKVIVDDAFQKAQQDLERMRKEAEEAKVDVELYRKELNNILQPENQEGIEERKSSPAFKQATDKLDTARSKAYIQHGDDLGIAVVAPNNR